MAVKAGQVLSARQLNRALLARQLLLERAAMPLPRALERIGGIQAQYAPSMYIGLWSRLGGFERGALTIALEQRKVVQGTSLRSTIHLVSPRDWWRFWIAVVAARKEHWLRTRKGDPSEADLEAAAKRVSKRLAEGPLSRAEMDELVGLGARGVNAMSVWLSLVRVPPSGTWERRRADVFAAAEEWIGKPPKMHPDAAAAELVRSYLRGFGPSTPGEIADWAGFPTLTEVNAGLARLQLRRFRTEDGTELVDLPRQPLPDPETPAPVRFLPTWDATLLVHARRTEILREEDRPRVFNPRTPQSVATFTVDGQVGGTWKFERGSIRVEPFRKLSRTARRDVDSEAERLAAFHA